MNILDVGYSKLKAYRFVDGGGFIQVDSSEQDILPKPVRLAVTKGVPMFSMSVFHQLHCLVGYYILKLC